MTNTQNNIPQLRFPEFEGEWVEEKLNRYCNKIASGKSKQVENEVYNLYGSTGIIGKTNKYSNDGKFILIARVGANAGLINIVDGKFGVTDNTLILDLNENIDIYFIYSLLLKYNLNRLVFGSGQPLITGGQLKSLKLMYPSKKEQQKIANFLTAVDSKLQALKKKKALLEQYKKGIMQKLFTVKTDGRPSLRFKDENGKDFPDWEVKKLGDEVDYEQPTKYLVSSTEYDNSYKTPVLTAGKTFILGYTDEINNIFENKLPVIIFDDFTTATKYVNFPFKAKSSAMKILIAKEKENIKFIYEVMQTIKFEIGGHGRHWISIYSKMNLLFPCREEQTKIANFLSAIDDKITKTDNQIEQTGQWKKGLLQKMFCN